MPETFPKRSRDKVWKVKAAPKDANPPARPSQDKLGEGNEETDKFIRSMEDEGMRKMMRERWKPAGVSPAKRKWRKDPEERRQSRRRSSRRSRL